MGRGEKATKRQSDEGARAHRRAQSAWQSWLPAQTILPRPATRLPNLAILPPAASSFVAEEDDEDAEADGAPLALAERESEASADQARAEDAEEETAAADDDGEEAGRALLDQAGDEVEVFDVVNGV